LWFCEVKEEGCELDFADGCGGNVYELLLQQLIVIKFWRCGTELWQDFYKNIVVRVILRRNVGANNV